MKKAIITRFDGGMFGASMEEAELNAWIEEQKRNNGWGYPAREMPKNSVPTDKECLIIEEYEKVIEEGMTMPVMSMIEEDGIMIYERDDELNLIQATDSEGNLLFEELPDTTETYVKLRSEYTIVIEDVPEKTASEKRRERYLVETDPLAVKAFRCFNLDNNAPKWLSYLEKVNKIKSDLPDEE